MGKKEDIELLQIQVAELHARLDSMQMDAENKSDPTLVPTAISALGDSRVKLTWTERSESKSAKSLWTLNITDMQAKLTSYCGTLTMTLTSGEFEFMNGVSWAYTNTTPLEAQARVSERIMNNIGWKASET